MPIDLERLKSENAKAITAVNNSLTRLMALARNGLQLPDAAAVNAQRTRAESDKGHLETVRAHLEAAGVVVKPMDASVESRLDTLAARLDDGIRNDFATTATIDLIKVVLGAAEGISDIALKNTKK